MPTYDDSCICTETGQGGAGAVHVADHGRVEPVFASSTGAQWPDALFRAHATAMALVGLLVLVLLRLALAGSTAVRAAASFADRVTGLVAVGAGLLALLVIALSVRRAWVHLVWRPAQLHRGATRMAVPHDDDEIGRMLHEIEQLREEASVSGARARASAQVLDDVRARHVAALGCLQQVVGWLSEGSVAEFSLQKTLGLLAAACAARAAGLRLTAAVGEAIHCPELLTWQRLPAILGPWSEEDEPGPRIESARTPEGRLACCLIVPVRCDGDVIALLAVEAAEGHVFAAADLALAEVVATQIASAVLRASQGQEERRGALLAERAAIARELHDSLAQSLAFLKIQVAQLQLTLRDPSARESSGQLADQVRQGIAGAYRQVKELISAFRARIDARGLERALEEAVDEFGVKGRVAIVLDYRLRDCPLTSNEEFHVLQVVREALSNTVRHARARHVCVTLDVADGQVAVAVEDDGRGFDPDPILSGHHFGLAIMRERAESLGGEIVIERRSPGGTVVRLVFVPVTPVPEYSSKMTLPVEVAT